MAYQEIFPRSGTKSKKRKVVREGPYVDIYIMQTLYAVKKKICTHMLGLHRHSGLKQKTDKMTNLGSNN